MNFYFWLSFITGVVLQSYYLNILSKTAIFRKKPGIAGNKKTCIQQLHKQKDNTPSMGGLAIAGCLIIGSMVYLIEEHTFFGLGLFILLYGALGMIDDLIKIKQLRDGISSEQKMLGILAISVPAVWYLFQQGSITTTSIELPFISVSVELGKAGYFFLLIFLLALSTNGMNITDGLDGLAIGIAIFCFVVIGIIAWQMQVPEVVFGCIVMGAACIATFFFNKFPARVFMGDTGSLMLGGAIGLFLIRLGLPLWIPIILGVCVFEIITDVIQIFAIRVLNRRVFLIAPFHHHLEKKGMKETTIVYLFWTVTMLCGVAGYSAYLLRH